MARATPPRALPSNLVTIKPVTSTASVKIFAWVIPFWPVVASITKRTSETGSDFSSSFGKELQKQAVIFQ